MPSDFNVWRTIVPRLSRADYAVWMKTIHNSLSFDTSDVAKYRCHVLDHYYQFGWRSAVNAFGVRKSTLYDWKQTYETSKKRLDSLIPHTTRPHQTRTMKTDWRLVEFVKQFRAQYGNIDREKIKIFLDAYALGLNLTPISASVIGKIIRRHQLFYRPKRVRRTVRLSGITRLKYVPKVTNPGYLQMDSIILYLHGKRYTFFSLIDVVTKYAYAARAISSASQHAVRILHTFIETYPYPVVTVQTDNGHEFLGDFQEYCVQHHLTHEFIYPRSPRINGVVERFNRTLQEECLNRYDYLDFTLTSFQATIDRYLHWYNQRRPHMSLAYQSPVQFMANTFPKSV